MVLWGRPEPHLFWFINGKPSDSRATKSDSHVVVNRLEVTPLQREHLNTTYKCQATNTNLINPQEKSVRLEMNLKPTSVVIKYKPSKLKTEITYTVVCTATGSRPAAQVIWYRDNRRFRRGKVTESFNETLVVSTLSFTPSPEDDGTRLRCQADNPRLPGVPLEDSFLLNVVYPPLVNLALGSTLNPNDIKEGDDVYFECTIKANPKEHRISWYHNDKQVIQNLTGGIILSTRSLVLQRVARHHVGGYTCKAANERGETTSQPVRLRVQYAPVCSTNEVMVIGAALDEMLKVKCSVDADPSDVSFVWQFNNSGESFDVSPARYGTSNGASELRYMPSSPRDYGTLSCRGTNTIGRQTDPCLYQMIPAARPSALRNCTLQAANTTDVFEVRCVAGNDGGLPQSFVLEAIDTRTKKTRLNITSPSSEIPIFRIEPSELWTNDGTDTAGGTTVLDIVLYARNQKGKSDTVILENISFNDAEKRTEESTGGVPLPWAAAVAILCALCAAALCSVTFVVCRRLYRGGTSPSEATCTSKPPPPPPPQAAPQNAPLSAPLTAPRRPPGSLLEINTGEQRYVVAYTLKNNQESRQPDILNPRSELSSNGPVDPAEPEEPSGRGARTPPGGTAPPNGAPTPAPRPDALFSARDLAMLDSTRHRPDLPSTFISPQSSVPGNTNVTNVSTLGRQLRRRDHIITNTIPGPESCV